jgi:hypothetical protein
MRRDRTGLGTTCERCRDGSTAFASYRTSYRSSSCIIARPLARGTWNAGLCTRHLLSNQTRDERSLRIREDKNSTTVSVAFMIAFRYRTIDPERVATSRNGNEAANEAIKSKRDLCQSV